MPDLTFLAGSAVARQQHGQATRSLLSSPYTEPLSRTLSRQLSQRFSSSTDKALKTPAFGRSLQAPSREGYQDRPMAETGVHIIRKGKKPLTNNVNP